MSTVWYITPKGADTLDVLTLFQQKAASEGISLPEVELTFDRIRDRLSPAIQVFQLMPELEKWGLVGRMDEPFKPEFEHKE